MQKRLTLDILESRRSWSKIKLPPSPMTLSSIMSWKMGIGDVWPSHDSRSPIEPERDRDHDRDRIVTRVKEVGSPFSMELVERPRAKEDAGGEGEKEMQQQEKAEKEEVEGVVLK